MMGEKPGDPITLLVVSSMFREEMPWLYELGLEAYRAARTGPPEEAERTLHRFRRAAEVFERGPFPVEELGVHPEELHMILRELRHFLMREPPKEDDAPAKTRRKKEGKQE